MKQAMISALGVMRQKLLKFGWIKGNGHGPNCEVCLVTAVPIAWNSGYGHVSDNIYATIASDALVQERSKVKGYSSNVGRMILFNDHPDTTLEDVYALLDRVQEQLEHSNVAFV